MLLSGWTTELTRRVRGHPDLKHKVTKKALWIDRQSTPAWVKARLTLLVPQGSLQRHAAPDTKQRLPMSNSLLAAARESRLSVQGGGGGGNGIMHVQSARTLSEAIAMLKNRLQQGMLTDSYMYLQQKDLAAKQVHDCIIKSGMDQNTYVVNNLLRVYIRCNRLQEARRVFDGLVKKDVITWNVMIGGYAQHNHSGDAIEVFRQVCQEIVEANGITYLSILKACVSPTALKWGKEVHTHIRHAGLESDVRVVTALLQMYAKYGCIKEAEEAFEKLTNRDVLSWNVMIGAYIINAFVV